MHALTQRRPPANSVKVATTCTRHPRLRQQCGCGQHRPGGGEYEECRKERVGAPVVGAQLVQRRAANQADPTAVPPIVYDVLRSSGQPLEGKTRGCFEPRFGHDFRGVARAIGKGLKA
jgi:hypothetical protein